MTGLSEGNHCKTFLRKVIQRAKSRTNGWQSFQNHSLLDSQFIRYLKCPTSVRMKMMSDQPARHFAAETPILAWNKHYSKAEYQRLSKFGGNFGWKDMKEMSVASALALLNSSHNRYMFDDRMVKGSIPNDKKCIRCAVIGNGGMLNGSMMGKEIDANDYVFRVNTALTKGHESDVGTRTSFYCFTLVTYYNSIAQRFRTGFYGAPADEGIRYVFFANSLWTYKFISDVLNKRRPTRVSSGKGWWMMPPKFPKQLTANNIKLVHPDFMRYLKLSWVNSPAKFRSVHTPSTGASMLLLALHTCDEVNVYGFGGSDAKFSDHYYDKTFYKRVHYANHDFRSEDKLWHLLHERGIINLYTRA
ncbi:alpha-N-acetylgalactosaminide alpha-2,6-sialyltransferase 2-like [Asterias amurensis]|uniref:alpha-N-acetylgalactosaminide alpha-2,6-sialyltransferase 2-like n=1 Tax=Asterias amurensis TaxID=7602 RepID=UPI003AB193FC